MSNCMALTEFCECHLIISLRDGHKVRDRVMIWIKNKENIFVRVT
jgi:hypothetical protein